MPFRKLLLLSGLAFSLIANAATDTIAITQAWARATAPGQDVGAAYMVLQSPVDATLLEVSSPAADSIEIHKMSMDHGIMKMRMLESLPLPAGKWVKLEPGGFHLMLFDLKTPLKAGMQLSLTMKFKEKSGKPYTRQIQVPVRAVQE